MENDLETADFQLQTRSAGNSHTNGWSGQLLLLCKPFETTRQNMRRETNLRLGPSASDVQQAKVQRCTPMRMSGSLCVW